jgi:hypothetical protein
LANLLPPFCGRAPATCSLAHNLLLKRAPHQLITSRTPRLQTPPQTPTRRGGLFTGLLTNGKAASKVDAAVGLHASSLTPADIEAVTLPLSLQAADPALDAQINATFFAFIDKVGRAGSPWARCMRGWACGRWTLPASW